MHANVSLTYWEGRGGAHRSWADLGMWRTLTGERGWLWLLKVETRLGAPRLRLLPVGDLSFPPWAGNGSIAIAEDGVCAFLSAMADAGADLKMLGDAIGEVSERDGGGGGLHEDSALGTPYLYLRCYPHEPQYRA